LVKEEFIRKDLQQMVQEVCSEKGNAFNTETLTRATMARRVGDSGSDLFLPTRKLSKKI
jgi:hypothetical protein